MSRTLKAIAAILTAVSVASAGSICAYTSRNCTGSYGCCSNISPGVCCTYPTNYGWSTLFTSMPTTPYWIGRTYGDTCSTSTGGAGSSEGQICLSVYNAPTYLNARSSNWDDDTRSRRSLDARETSACVEVDMIGFVNKDGTTHKYRIPDGKSFSDIEKLVADGKLVDLLQLEKADV